MTKQLFNIFEKDAGKVWGRNYWPNQIHYQFIDKKADREKYLIQSIVNPNWKMTYEEFKKHYPIEH